MVLVGNVETLTIGGQDCNVYKRNVANGTVEARKKKKMKPVTATSAEEVVRTKNLQVVCGKWYMLIRKEM